MIFLPVVFMRTISGMLFKELALVVVFALMCSLLVALTLVPMLASRYLHLGRGETVGQGGPLARFGAWFRGIEEGYARRLEIVLRHRTVVFLVTGVLLAGAILAWPLLPVELAPQTDADEIDVDLEMAQGTNIAVVNEYLHELERIVREAAPMEDVKHVSIEIRNGDAEVELVPARGRRAHDGEHGDRRPHSRAMTAGKIPGAQIRVTAQSGLWMLRRLFGSGGGSAVQIELRGYDLALADRVAQDLKTVMEQIPEIADVNISRREGRPEQNLLIDREKIANLGLTVREVAETIQANVGGVRAGVFREGGRRVSHHRAAAARGPPDRPGPGLGFGAHARRPGAAGFGDRRRRPPPQPDHHRARRRPAGDLHHARTSLRGAALGDVINDLQGRLRSFPLPADFSLLFGGEYEEQQKAQRDFMLSIIMAVVLIYMVMAAQFERFLDPMIVMFSVPLALIGVVPTLLLTGTSLNVQSLMGIVMLIGIVVNNAIVLVDYINLKRREDGMDRARRGDRHGAPAPAAHPDDHVDHGAGHAAAGHRRRGGRRDPGRAGAGGDRRIDRLHADHPGGDSGGVHGDP